MMKKRLILPIQYSHQIKSLMVLVGLLTAMVSKSQIPTSDISVISRSIAVQTFSTTDDNGKNNSELLNNFVQDRFDELLPSYNNKKNLRRSAAEYLSGNDLNAYNYLKSIVRKIALGEISNTAISIPLTEITSDVGPWTAEELGVSAICENNQLNSEAINAAIKKVEFDINKVVTALLVDCPYELFWYDKTKGCSYTTSDSYSYNVNQLSISRNTTFTMYVAQEYAVQEGSQYYPTKFNTAKVAAVNVAVANAKSIAESTTGSTFKKLLTFRDRICELTSYNNTAAASSYYPYGDPWQLVWVFDGDESTKVVCEGYSKAFKYLCDLSGFQDTECLIATGVMNGGTGAGNHMWNVMKMDDGRSYLIDVTNCDEGTIGAPNLLFMACGPSGDYAQGYTFPVGDWSIKYTYDDNTLSTFTENELTISDIKYVLPTITADNKSKTYGDENPELTFTVSDRPYTGTPALTTTATTTSPVGDYDIVVPTSEEYNAVNGTLTINKKALTISGGRYTITKGSSLPEFQASYDGFVNNETETVLTTQPTLTTTATSESSRGDYEVVVAGATAANYDITHQNGVLTITEVMASGGGTTIEQGEDGYFVVTVDEESGESSEGGVITTQLDSEGKIVVAELTYDRELRAPEGTSKDVTIDGSDANLYTICLPKAPAKATNVKYYTLNAANSATLVFTEVNSSELAANTPYLVAVTSGSNLSEGQNVTNVTLKKEADHSTEKDGFIFKGTLTGLTNAAAAAEGAYILQSGNVWGKVTTTNTGAYIPPFRAYIVAKTAGAPALLNGSIGDENPTSIQNIRTVDLDGTERWYDLNGKRIQKPTKGINIVNGRKVVIK